ncbi:MAG: prolyl oligopeptidase family serine peptidase [Candidatus Liptonbacteria bacterium]|nr:prolyl oligopeptidase family serine peptidase [Candidatus Liptonbacteria bacterium]
MHAFRTRFKKDIVAEFLPALPVPNRIEGSRVEGPHRKKTNKVIIFCSGMPTVPAKAALIEFFAKKGYWFFFPRYRGTWESSGKFLRYPLDKDILDVINSLPRGFKDLWSGKKYKVESPEVYLLGSSFGGPAGILASRDRRVKKVVAVSPIVDWTVPSRAERLGWVWKYWREAFGEGIRSDKKDWNKLEKGSFYNPVRHIKEIDGKKILIIHAKDDRIVTYGPVAKFAKAVGAKLITLKKGGHLSSTIVVKPKFYKKVMKFLRS